VNYQRIRLDTWLRTYALHPEDFVAWFNQLDDLKVFKTVTFALEPDESTTGIAQTITLEDHGIHTANK